MEHLIKINVIRPILILQFVFLSTVFTFLTIEGKNILFMGFSILGAFALLVLNKRTPLNTSKTTLIILLYLIVSYLMNCQTADHLSFVYSIFFVCSFIIFISFFKKRITQRTFRKVAFYILILYLIILIVGQLYVALGFFQGTHISRGLLHGPFGTLFEADGGFRYYSLSSEPSYAAFIVLCLLYTILENDPDRKPFSKINLYAWLITIYMLLSFQSGYGMLLFFILVLFQSTPKNAFIIFTVCVFGILGTLIVKQTALSRLANIVSNLRLSQIEELRTIDHSASFRILPTYYYLKNIELADYHFYFGHGAGQSSDFLIPYLFKVHVDTYEGGFLPQFLYDYGVLFALLLIIFLQREVLTHWLSFETVVVLLVLTNANFNTQLFWFVITCFALNKCYLKQAQQANEQQSNLTHEYSFT